MSTVREYFHILEDTLVARALPAWTKTAKRKAIATAKHYFFDIGVVRHLQHRAGLSARSPEFGEAFESYIFHELSSWIDYNSFVPLAYWRSGRPPAGGGSRDPARDGCGLIWYAPLVPMVPERVVRYVEWVTAGLRAHHLEPLITLTSVSDRCFDSSVPLLFDRDSSAAVERARRCAAELLAQGCDEGFVPYRVGIDAMGWLESRPLHQGALAKRLRDMLDPQGTLSPGRYG